MIVEGGKEPVSQEVDERVVEMRFDNAQFEKNVHQTMQSIES